MPNHTKVPILGIRHVQVLLTFITIITAFVGRHNVGVSLVAMTNANTTNPNFPQYNWTVAEKSYVLSSFFWGSILTDFIGGYFSKLFGVKKVIIFAILSSGVCSGLAPLLIPWGDWRAYCGTRVLMGCAHGLIFPSIHQHLARWCPPEERNRLGAFSYMGIDCGNVLSMFVSGMIAKGPMGWPGISYISAAVAFTCCILWYIFGSNNPTESRFIGETEKHYIESSLHHGDNFHKVAIPIPWRAIWTSVPFLALLVARCADIWGYNMFVSEIPAYMNGVLQMDIKENAFFSALPFVVAWIMSYVFLVSSDILLNKKWASLTAVRRIMNSLGFFVPAAGLIAIGFLDVNQKILAIVLMTLSVSFNSGSVIGSCINAIDLSPNHTSILLGIAGTLSTGLSMITPLVKGAIVADESDRTQWQLVFIICSVIFFVSNCIYLAFGTTETQPWDAEDFLQAPHIKLPKPAAITSKSDVKLDQ